MSGLTLYIFSLVMYLIFSSDCFEFHFPNFSIDKQQISLSIYLCIVYVIYPWDKFLEVKLLGERAHSHHIMIDLARSLSKEPRSNLNFY